VLTSCFICRLFNVVWGKQSKKKHKTWEGDGILEVEEKTVILKVNYSAIGILKICFVQLTSLMDIPLEQLVICFFIAVEPYYHRIEALGSILSQMRPDHILTNSV
jgi:hypothetical protein